MKAAVLNICLAVFLIAAGYVWGNHSVAHAAATNALPPGRIFTIPKTWGHVVGGMAGNTDILILEDPDGVVRVVDAFGGDVREQLNRQ